MIKKILLICTMMLGLSAIVSAQNSNVKPLTIGEIRTFKSKILNEERTLNIYLPQNFDKTKSYPVIYLLDGSMNEDFIHVTGLIQFFNQMYSMPETIVVGIANIDRKRDFTFHTDLKDLQKDYPTTGHSDQFISFLEKELKPYIESQFKITDKYLFGQSLGGLLATEILLKKPELFNNYFIISPSLWWDDESLLKGANQWLAKIPDTKKFIYISVGKGEHPVMVKDAEDLYDVLKKAGKKNWTIEYKMMETDNHATILHRSLYEGLVKLFPYQEPEK
ncbi:putative alpha/beta superfamily hydrolase [Chryseobacterium sp. SORGH_AS909]|uniref:alpha/beta hydrolase n=1 Tax=unclassified Chryseobacterium TaxID=2593645 RepID=UPI002785E054|nr:MULTISPECIES: alpha/beta hydrolase-fold protein [unclassified Chryseobacterium]MDQ1102678.1 putative alpha/beta superfamily hydrolase [Chryseobacterium sp. SORGH_AS_1048]MDR6086106.1 putative alpha/beta superfamily hydrolase [Chryseobacterium sp. SORGH_AS_0909]MDR6130476.1 putative alpha/beta superfamily hydrolase [Chryseobacterium sp. SORGH_AS_1175]MDT3407397.1 putative alpha/beta superfamily hydrolase [Pseudacidovorax intermedius]